MNRSEKKISSGHVRHCGVVPVFYRVGPKVFAMTLPSPGGKPRLYKNCHQAASCSTIPHPPVFCSVMFLSVCVCVCVHVCMCVYVCVCNCASLYISL